MSVRLYLGGTRSGKSGFAEEQALELLRQGRLVEPKTRLHYVATAEPFDDEMKDRISLHRARRDDQWVNHEYPVDLADALKQFNEHDIVLVDCLTVWLNNIIYYLGDSADSPRIQAKLDELTRALDQTPATVLCVSTEVGLGVVPMNAITRLYVDHSGWMNQAVAKIAGHVDFVVAGLPMTLKGQQ